jgi:hypothetical protein
MKRLLVLSLVAPAVLAPTAAAKTMSVATVTRLAPGSSKDY